MSSKSNKVFKMVLAAMFLAVALVLPFFTGQIQQIGNMLCPMHLPVILCGYFCGPWYALLIGIAAPLLRFVLFGMPPIVPIGIAMCFELAVYGVTAGLLYRAFPQKLVYIYLSLIISMISGRIVWGAVQVVLAGLGKIQFGWEAFIGAAFINAIPGIILQLILIPILVRCLKKYTAR